jgi:TonB family protein
MCPGRNQRAADRWRKIAIELSVIGAILLASCLPVAHAQRAIEDYQVEAAYLYNFAKMAKWSSKSLPDSADLVIGVLGGDEDFVSVLRDVLAGKSINGHRLDIRHIRSTEEVKFCHLVFFRASELTTRSTIAQLGKSNVLLVGENRDFLSDGGMINLVLADGKITFDVNAAALEHAAVRYDNTVSVVPKTDVQTDVQPGGSPRSIAFRVTPDLPRIAAVLKITGTVQLQARVRADGTVKQVRVMGGHPALAEAASQAVMQWRYEPGSKETTELVKISFGR